MLNTPLLITSTPTSSQPPNPAYWCKFQAVDTPSFIIISSVIFVQFALFCLFVRSLLIRLTYKIFISSDESYLFKLMAVWFITFIKSILNIVVYVVYETDDKYENEQIEIIIAGVCLFLDKMSSFALHTILLKIPCIWIKNSIMKLQNQQLTLTEMKRVDKVFKVLNIMRVYLKIRMIIFVINLGFVGYFVVEPNFGQYAKYLYSIWVIFFRTIFTMGEAAFAISIYTFGIVSLNRFKELLDFPKELQNRVIVEYLLLMFGCLARLLFNFLYYFYYSVKSYKPNPNCSDSNHTVSYIGYLYLSVGYTVMHILPIITIILIYWPDTQKYTDRESVLSVDRFDDIRRKIKIETSSCLLGSGTVFQSQRSSGGGIHSFIQYYNKKQNQRNLNN